jgi:hypothetical protein
MSPTTGLECAQVYLLQEFPNGACGVIGFDQSVQIKDPELACRAEST